MDELLKLLLKIVVPVVLVVSLLLGGWFNSDPMASSGSPEPTRSEPLGLWLTFSNCSGSAEFMEGRTVWLYGAGASLYETTIYLVGYSDEVPVHIVLERTEGWTFTPPSPCFHDPGTNPHLTEVSSFPLHLRGNLTVRRGDLATGELGTFDVNIIEYVSDVPGVSSEQEGAYTAFFP